MNASDTLSLVNQTLEAARKHGLEAEVMYVALIMAAEANEHGLSMEEVLNKSLAEWDIDVYRKVDDAGVDIDTGKYVGG
jgi:hypothetical protein